MVIGVWMFAIIWLVGMLVLQADLLFAIFIFLIAIVISVVATALPTAPSRTDSQGKTSG